MDDYRNDRIIYDEGWQKVSTPEVVATKTDEEADENIVAESIKKEKKKKERSFPALVSIQLVICIMIAVVLFALKYLNFDTFSKISDWYHDMTKITLVPNSTFENFDLSSYLPSTVDQLASTKDEI